LIIKHLNVKQLNISYFDGQNYFNFLIIPT